MTSGSVTADQAVSSRCEKLRRQAVHVSCGRHSLGEGTRDRALQGQDESEPETLRPVIASVECHPFPGDRVQGLEPLRDGHGLPGGGTAGHQRHPPVGLGQNLAQARTGNRSHRDRRAPELRAWNRKRGASRDGPRAHTHPFDPTQSRWPRGARDESPIRPRLACGPGHPRPGTGAPEQGDGNLPRSAIACRR